MTGKGDRTHPATEYDKTRGNVALARLGNALGVRLDSSKPDHELLELLADGAIAQRREAIAQASERCPCPACTRQGDA